jgi:hypothetical protein
MQKTEHRPGRTYRPMLDASTGTPVCSRFGHPAQKCLDSTMSICGAIQFDRFAIDAGETPAGQSVAYKLRHLGLLSEESISLSITLL